MLPPQAPDDLMQEDEMEQSLASVSISDAVPQELHSQPSYNNMSLENDGNGQIINIFFLIVLILKNTHQIVSYR